MTPPSATGVFLHPVQVRFGDCDPAGIAYFPRFFEWFHEAMEAWFDDALGRPYHEVLRRHGFPAVHTECDYAAPCRFGDRITVELRLGALGQSSLRLDYTVRGAEGGVRASAHTRVVMIGTDPTLPDHLRSVPIPDDLRARLEAFRSGTPGAAGPPSTAAHPGAD